MKRIYNFLQVFFSCIGAYYISTVISHYFGELFSLLFFFVIIVSIVSIGVITKRLR
jgi:hypothetical protein